MDVVQRLAAHGEVATGLIYIDGGATDLHQALGTSATPLNRLDERALCPGAATLASVNAALR